MNYLHISKNQYFMKKLLLFFFVFCVVHLQAAIIYVKHDATGLNNGTSWANAYTDLEMALLFAMSGDEVWVARGTYYTSNSNDRTSSFVLNNGVKLYGNFFGNETSISQRVDLIPDASGSDRTNETMLSGDIGISGDMSDNANHVFYIVGNTLPVIIDGVKITGGNAILTVGKGQGGGIFIDNVGVVQLSNLIVTGNIGSAGTIGRGGGVYVNNATSFLLENSVVSGNSLVDDLTATGSSYNYFGGGIFVNSPQNQVVNSYIFNNLISSSRSNSRGGGLYIENSLNTNITDTEIKNNTISSSSTNSSRSFRGVGLACYGINNSSFIVNNSEITGNNLSVTTGSTYGTGGFFQADTLRVADCLFNGNTTTNNGTASGTSNHGGGMYATVVRRAFIQQSEFNLNQISSRYAHGGGMYLLSSNNDTSIVHNCSFVNNIMQSSGFYDGNVIGGGMLTSVVVKITDCMFNNNSITVSSTATSASLGGTSYAHGGGITTYKFTDIKNSQLNNNNAISTQNYVVQNFMTFPAMNSRANGGGIYSTTRLSLTNSQINNNIANAHISSLYIWSTPFNGHAWGGGIHNEFTTTGQKSLVENCSVENNSASTFINLANGSAKGGGIYARNMDIFRNTIVSNETYVDISVNGGLNQGGGIYHEGRGHVYSNFISDNKAIASTAFQSGGYTSNSYGGGLYTNSIDSVANSQIDNNRVVARNTSQGGGIYNVGTSKFSNLTIAENTSYSETGTMQGSGVYTNNSNAQMLNSIIYFNENMNYFDQTSNSLVRNCVIQSYQSGNTNFNINPQFIDTAANNYRVIPTSIAVDRGDSTYLPAAVVFDLDGNDRISGLNVDMGCFEIDLCKSYTSIFETICAGDVFVFNGQNLTLSGIYKDTLTNIANCDSIVTLYLTVDPGTTSSIIETVCDSYTAPDGQVYTTSGLKTAVIPNSAGCDSTITINLTVNQSSVSSITETVCDSYTAPDGQVYTTSGLKTAVIPNTAGCDSTITIQLTVNQSTVSSITETVCDSYIAPDGQVYTTSGLKTAVIPNSAGCDSTITIKLTVNQSTVSSITETVCDSYTAPDGQIYTTSGMKTAVIPNTAGCDSTITIQLTVNQSTVSSNTETVCDSYIAPDGQVYTTSGLKTAVIPNSAGCDSTITINLTVNQSTVSSITETVCDSYTAPDGQIYTTSGLKTAVIPNSADCDSTITINLTVNQSTVSSITETVCDSYTAPDGQVYTTSGLKTALIPNSAGCDSTITINLTVNQSTVSTITETVCDSYTAPDGQVYTTSGLKTAVIPNSAGCDSTITINLTVNQSTVSSITETVCDSYIAPDGQVYTTSDLKTAVIPNSAGCDSTITINLTVTLSTVSSITETVCDSYTAPDGQIYTTSGLKTALIPNSAGCDSTITINLTVNQSTVSTITETVCDSYTAPDGQVYTTSGLKTAVIPNSAGCDSTITINLTVNQSTVSSITETVCDSYIAPDGQIYTTSGLKTAVIPNSAGCDSTITINLTVNQSTFATIYETVCFEYVSPSGNHIWTVDDMYYDTIPNTAGCDSVITIHLTVNTVETGISLNGATLTAHAFPATYQWIDCNGNIPVTTETNQDFTPVINGYYACLITQNGCTDTTACIPVFTVDVSGNANHSISVFPNPADDHITIDLGQKKQAVVEIRDFNGRLILKKTFAGERYLSLPFDVASGMYLVHVITAEGKTVVKVVRN
jgi:trimeric autotransporter adhesin